MSEMKVPKEVRKRVKAALREGWNASLDGKGHVRLSKSGFVPITISSSPRDTHWLKNCESQMKKAGI